MSAVPDAREVPVLSVEEAGRVLGLGRSAAYSAVQRGEIPSLRLGRRRVVPTASLCALLGLDPIRDDAPPVEGEASVISLNSGGTRRDHPSTA